MEIIMKVKCSPSPGPGSSPHSSLKIVDHHHQLNQQHTYATTNTATVYKSNTPPQNVIPPRTYTPNNTHHHPGGKYPIAPPTATSPPSAACNDCSLGYCCNMPQCCVTTPSPQYSQTPPQIQPALSSPFSANEQYSSNSCPSSVVADEPEFVSIDDEKVKQYLIRLGREKLQKQQQAREQQRQCTSQSQPPPQLQRPVKEPKITRVFSAPSAESAAKPVVYEIIELDDEDEREKLKQIKQQAEQRIANKKLLSTNPHINFATRNTKSLDISLIPKSNENRTQNSSLETTTKITATRTTKNDPSNHKIIAEIDLLESDDDDVVDHENNGDKYKDDDNDEYMKDDNDDNDDDDDDDETLPLAAVSCELECDDDDDDIDDVLNPPSRNPAYNRNYSQQQQRQPQQIIRYSKPLVNDVVIVGSDEDKHHDDNLLVRWEEYEGQRERVFFECFLCGKKVQSSYNLRRHMMIHTGERPFGCDLCDRRFREFSDLKKHRRRHSNEPNYLCMVCHKQKPVEIDPTRCRNCCTQSKNAVIMAAMKPATEADMAAESKARIKAATEAKIAQTSSAALKAKMNPQTTQTTQLPTIASVTSYNAAAKTSQTQNITITTASKRPVNGDGSSSGTTSPKATEQTQGLLDNIPAVHRPGYTNLGMITRKEFPCPLCNRAFGTRHNLKRHYMIHTGEKPFSCNKCRKPFREFSTLKKHMVTHMRERWYKCSHCTVKFRDFLKYTEHKETHTNDIDNEERLAVSRGVSYGKLDVDSYMIDSNDEESGPEDWLECCECGQRFNEIDAYNEHLKEHDVNNKIFECYICKENMKSRSELDKHLRLQHKYEIENDMMDNDDDGDDIDGDYDNDNEEGEEEEEFITA